MSFLLNRKLKRWVEASLINEDVALKIQAFEAAGTGTNVMHATVGIGALTIVTGIISIIAANWYLIPPHIKLLSNFSWLTAIAIALGLAVKNEKSLPREVLSLVYFGSFLGSIALVGQVYHLNSHPVYGLTFWLILGAPVLFLAQSRYASFAWVAAIVTWSFAVQDWIPGISELNLPAGIFITLYAGIGLYYMRLRNPHFALTTLYGGSLLLVGYIFSVGSMAWSITHSKYLNPSLAAISFAVLLPYLAFAAKNFGRHLALLLLAGSLYAFIPQSFLHGDLKEFGAIFFIALCAGIAHYAVKIQHKKIFELACLAIAFRIIMIYFEVFGSLLETGFGLIGSGTFIIFIVWMWKSGRGRLWRRP